MAAALLCSAGGNGVAIPEVCSQFIFQRCDTPIWSSPSYDLALPGCDLAEGPCEVVASLTVEFPGNRLNSDIPGATATLTLVGGSPSSCASSIEQDFVDIEVSRDLDCGAPPATETLQAVSCPNTSGVPGWPCAHARSLVLDSFHSLCPPPPPDPLLAGCADRRGSGAAAPCFGPLESLSLFGIGPGLVLPSAGPRDLELAYQAGGAGFPEMPGTSAHLVPLGRGWTHRFEQRIVDTGDPSRAWLLGSRATFRSLRDDDLDQSFVLVPADDPAHVERLASSWVLHHPDGSEDTFDESGLWASFVDRFGNQTVANRTAGVLNEVSLPDGRALGFGYHPSGKLASIVEIGVDTVTTRTWLYTWSGDDLSRVERPDGTAWELFYEDPSLPGYLTQLDLVTSGGAERRIAAAWGYTDQSLTSAWRGAETPGDGAAIEQVEVEFPATETTTLTDAVGVSSTWTWELEPSSLKPRLLSTTSGCPVCSGGPAEATWEWLDMSHPLSPSAQVDPSGRRTELVWSNQHVVGHTEAAGTALERSTVVTRTTGSPALIESIEQTPSNVAGCGVTRNLALGRDAGGALLSATISGCEAAGSYSHTTGFARAPSGSLTSIDPPGNGTADVTSFTFDPARGDLVVLTRQDPLVGTTTFTHDNFNRLTSRTDPNGLTTTWSYDTLDRLRFEVQEGAVPAEDLVTEWQYNTFGDLALIIEPRGNAVELGRDQHGRQIWRELKQDSSPTSHLERIVLDLDLLGRQVRKGFQRWDEDSWVEAGAVEFDYGTGCALERFVEDPAPHGLGTMVTEIATDCAGRPQRLWDAAHPRATFPTAAFTFGYDELGRLETRSAPWGPGGAPLTESFAWSRWDELAAVTDGEGGTTTIERSDRGLPTSLSAPGRGTTTFSWSPRGHLASTTDATGVTTSRVFDVAARITAENISGSPHLDRTLVWGSGATPFDRGRLIEVVRGDSAVAFEWDRFGRMVGEGPLQWGYDQNGNRVSLTHPDGTEVSWAFDGGNREGAVSIDHGSGPTPLAGVERRSPFGPADHWIWSQHDEIRSLDPQGRIAEISSAFISGHPGVFWELWDRDVLGDTIEVEANDPSLSRTFGRQPFQRLLTSATGPWVGPLSWSWNRAGGQESASRGAITDAYSWIPNGMGGDSPVLQSIALGGGGTSTLTSDAAGRLLELDAGANVIELDRQGDGTLAAIRRPSASATATVWYTPTGLLDRVDAWPPELIFADSFERGSNECWSAVVPAGPPAATCLPGRRLETTYTLGGELVRLDYSEADGTSDTVFVVPFEGQSRILFRPAETTPATNLSLDPVGRPLGARPGRFWRGVLDPFGRDPLDGTPQSLEEAGIPLRHPGHLEDPAWSLASFGLDLQLGATTEWGAAYGRWLRPRPVVRDALATALGGLEELDLGFEGLLFPYGGFGAIGWPTPPREGGLAAGLLQQWTRPFVVDLAIEPEAASALE